MIHVDSNFMGCASSVIHRAHEQLIEVDVTDATQIVELMTSKNSSERIIGYAYFFEVKDLAEAEPDNSRINELFDEISALMNSKMAATS